MHKITSEQMKEVLSVLVRPLEEQKAVFDALNLDPHSSWDDDVLNGSYILNISEIDEMIEDYCTDLSFFTDWSQQRIAEIEGGGPLTEKEEALLREIVCRELSTDAPLGVITELSDGEKSAFALYIQLLMGPSGIDITGFEGFFSSHDEAHKALHSLEDTVIYR